MPYCSQKLCYVLEIIKFHIKRQIPYLKSPLFNVHEMETYVAVVIFITGYLETAPDILVIPEKLYNAVFWESLIFQAKFEDISGCIWSLLTA